MLQLNEEIERPLPDNMDELSALQQLKLLWGLIVVLIAIAKQITGKRGDAKLDRVIEWGDKYLPK